MTEAASRRVPLWMQWAGPPALIAVLVVAFVIFNPIAAIRESPPVEAVAVERTILEPGSIELRLRNDGPDPVTIAQVLVDDAYWSFELSEPQLARLRSATLRIDYPWDEGLPLAVTLITSTGATVEHEIEVAVVTPGVDGRTIWLYSLLGIYIGVVPIAVGLLWLPALRRSSQRMVTAVLAATIGLLIFLLVDTTAHGLELAGQAAESLDGVGLFAIGALGAVAALAAIGRPSGATGRRLALMIAAGIGLHNLGEGLAVGAAIAAGEVALGSGLVLGFALHNTTEGLAIVAPFGGSERRPSLATLVLLGAVAGVPTIAGAWIGGFAFNPAVGALFFGLAAGAIGQVVWAIGSGLMRRERSRGAAALGFASGLVVMYVTALGIAS